MLRTIVIGVAIGLVTLWLWEKWQNSGGGRPGETILARIGRIWSTPTRRERGMPMNGSIAAAQTGGSCGCS